MQKPFLIKEFDPAVMKDNEFISRNKDQQKSQDDIHIREEEEKRLKRRYSLSDSSSSSNSSRTSDSSSNTSDSDSSSSDKKQKKKRKKDSDKRKKKKKDSKSNKKKDKDKKKKKKSKKKKSKKATLSLNDRYGSRGIISIHDTYKKESEFRAWVQEVKKISIEVLDHKATKGYFAEYVEDYNTATLPHNKYYDYHAWESAKVERPIVEGGGPEDYDFSKDEERAKRVNRASDPMAALIGYSHEDIASLKRVQEDRLAAERARKIGYRLK